MFGYRAKSSGLCAWMARVVSVTLTLTLVIKKRFNVIKLILISLINVITLILLKINEINMNKLKIGKLA